MTQLIASMIFLAWTVIFWIATACIAKVFFVATQEGQLLGKWQQVLRKWDISGTASGMLLSKIGGYCELCYSHAWGLIGFIVYATFTGGVIGIWPPSWGGLFLDILLNVVWAVVFVHTSTIVTLYFITKLFKNGTSNN